MQSTTLFKMLPWMGGLNTTEDPSMIEPGELTRSEHAVLGVRGSRRKRPGNNYDWDDQSNGVDTILAGHDFFYGTSAKTQKKVAVTQGKKIYTYSSSGVRSADLFAGTAWASSISQISFETITNLLIIAADGSGNVMKKYDGTTVNDLGVYTVTGDTTNGSPTVTNVSSTAGFENGATITGSGIPGSTTVSSFTATQITMSANATATATGVTLTVRVSTPPVASIVRSHLGRLWCNDKTNLDRLHYSSTENAEEWNGTGDSGAIDIGVGDGDPDGITAIFPTYKGELFVAKRTRLYRVSGQDPDTAAVTLVSSGIGCVSHNGIAQIDQDDMAFVSERGFHSLAVTDAYGDFEGKYLSQKIQGEFNDDFVHSRLKYIKATYVSSINSVVFAVTNERYGSTSNNALYLYHTLLGVWYTWPNISCEALFIARDSDKIRFYLGTTTGRITQCLTSNDFDTTSTGGTTAIPFKQVTGLIYVDDNPYTIKGFKKFALIFRPLGEQTVTVKIRIDNYQEQAIAFALESASDLLGSTFILGTSLLGTTLVQGPYTKSIDGYGRGIQITIEHNSAGQPIDIQGFAIEYEMAGTQQEVSGG